MFSYLWLLTKRFAVLLPGIVVAYASERIIFPYFHQHLPIAPAILFTYIIGAYGLVPATMRVWRLFSRPKHLPVYCVTPDGFASDPLNIGLVGSRKQLIAAMRTIGWEVAQPITLKTILATVVAIILRRPYPGAPMSNLYLFGRRQDIGFEQQLTEHGRGYRHHIRFWATTLSDMEYGEALISRKYNRQEQRIAESMLWVGAASLDIGITFAAGSLQFTHAVSPDTNRERTLLVRQLKTKGLAEPVSKLQLHPPYKLTNFAWSRTFRSDGKMSILKLCR